MLLALALKPLPCNLQQLDCATEKLVIKVGKDEAFLAVPKLAEGANRRWACAELFEGYESFIEVHCLGGILHSDASRCVAKGCKAGQKAAVRIAGVNRTLYAENSGDLEHGEDAQLPCATLVDGYQAFVDLSCRLGNLEADAGKCRPAFQAASTVWRLLNGDYLPGTWRVFEIAFFTSSDCETGKLEGTPVASSEDRLAGAWKHRAFDRDFDSAWAAHCDLGCKANTAWIGISLPQASDNVRCVQLRQSQVRCCGSNNVRLEVWDGREFQSTQSWDTSTMQRVRHSFELVVPITCAEGKPEAPDDRIVHDCDGPPVVGRQEGDVCVAECAKGFYGTATEYSCKGDGTFSGTLPTCYELKLWIRISVFVSTMTALFFLAWQYKFWCMLNKARLNDEEMSIPAIMKGKWLEQSGRHIWSEMAMNLRNKEKREEMLYGTQSQEGEKKPAEHQEHHMEVEKHTAIGAKASSHADGGDVIGQGEEADSMADDVHDDLEEMAQMQMVHGRIKEVPPSTDGLCTPCEDPDLCWACVLCPICRIADTWHTLGTPSVLTYTRIFFLYLLCPCLWPCLNFYGRLRVRMIFGIPLEPHRDCVAHCCCCCCCSPCAICQEARLVDAPTRLHAARKKQKEALERLE